MTPRNKALPNFVAPAVSRMKQYAAQYGPEATELTSLLRGEPDFPTPQHIAEALWAAVQAGYTHYPVIRGYDELREAVATRLSADYKLQFDPEREVLITSGATAGMYLALQAIVTSGDEVLLPQPIYDVYLNQVLAAGGVPVSVAAEHSGARFTLTVERLEQALTPRTRAIIINTPWNPTGTILNREELLAIGTFALGHGLILIVDEIYEKLVYDDCVHIPLVSLSDDFRDHVITVNSFSKTYAMTGWRLGYNLASPALTTAMLLNYEQFSRGATAFVQRAGIAALHGPQDCVTDMVSAYQARRDLMVKLVHGIDGVAAYSPQGGLFCLIDVRSYDQSSEALAHSLVRNWGLLTIPGSYYGPSLEGFLRLSFSYAPQDIERGLQILADGLEALKPSRRH